jgi:uncharacterized protein YgbK (DUF1537 family)
MKSLRLLADDLTGALDTAAEFVGLCGAFDVSWAGALPPQIPSSFAVDTGTRELDKVRGVAIVEALVPLLRDGTIAYKKVDSLLRGAWAAELGACLRSGYWKSCIVAPAFTFQGRRTRNGLHYALNQDGNWSPVGDNLLAQLAAENIDARQGRFDTELSDGVHVFDAETDRDLDRVVEIGRSYPGPVLWCGSGGLAGALARGGSSSLAGRLQRPALGLFGSDQATTTAQIAACGPAVVTLAENAKDNTDAVRQQLARHDVALVKFGLPAGISRGDAATRIACELGSLTSELDPPGTLIVAGGETLKALCLAVGAHALNVRGRIMPGLPRSVIQGGRWAGVEVISKSGAFGSPGLWRGLLKENDLIIMESSKS